MTSGNSAALSVISWEGYLSSLLGNTLMCSHFANSGERSAVTVQLIGIANNMAVLLQVALASYMPWGAFAAAAAAVAVAVTLSLARLETNMHGSAPPADASDPQPQKPSPKQQLGTWRTWQLLSGIMGLSVVAQVLYNTTAPAAPSYLPGAIALVVLCGWFAVPAHRQDDAGRLSVQSLPGWASTLLFAVAPLPQLVRNFLDARNLEGLSVGTMLLALLGNALMVPRAMFIQDTVWLAGTSWAVCAGWGQLLSMFLRTSPSTGLRYLSLPVFGCVSTALLAYFTSILVMQSRARAEAAAAHKAA